MPSDRRLHPSTVLFAFLTQIRLFVVPGLLVLVGASSRGVEWWMPRVLPGDNWWEPWMMLLIIPNALVALFRYLTYRYRYEDKELVIRSGLIFRRERHVPYARIQNIDAVQNVLHRVIGVADVKIETGGGDTAEATMSVLPMTAFHEMRARVFGERHAAPLVPEDGAAPAEGAEPAVTTGSPRPLLGLGIRELLLCGFIENRGAFVIAAGLGVLWELGVAEWMLAPLVGDLPEGRGGLRGLVRTLVADDGVITPLRVVLSIAAFAGVLLLIRVLSMGWAVVRLYGYRLTLDGGDARSEFGLLTRVAATVPLHRVQALTVYESMLHRWFGRVAVRVDTAGGRRNEVDTNADREFIAPILPRAALDGFVQAIVGEEIGAVRWQPAARGAFRREVKGWLFTAAVIALPAVALFGWWSAPLVGLLAAWAIVGAQRTVAHLGWATTADAVMVKRGWLTRRMVVVRFAKMQTVTRRASGFDRRWRMASLHVDTAGATSESVLRMPYLTADTAASLQAQLAAEAAQRTFTW